MASLYLLLRKELCALINESQLKKRGRIKWLLHYEHLPGFELHLICAGFKGVLALYRTKEEV
jgi:hypothetical protein